MNKYRFRDSDALALDPARGRHEASGQTRTHLLSHVSKHKKRDKALEIVFDPKAHKYVYLVVLCVCNMLLYACIRVLK